MFGYINPDSPYLFKKDEVLYKALYCGLCKSIGKSCGQTARTTLTYDMAFCAAILHNIRGVDVKIEKRRCFLHIKKRPMAATDDIMLLAGKINAVLAYFKLCDDKADGDKRGILRHLYKKSYKKTKKTDPEIVEIISRCMSAQKALEDRGSKIIEEAAEPSAQMLKELSTLALKESATDFTEGLFYAIGKWVYLIDALDDYDKDVKKGAYNVLYLSCGAPSKEQLVKRNGEEIKLVFDCIFAEMRANLNNIKFHFNRDLTDNIILRGIPQKTRSLFFGECEKGEKNEQKKS